MCCPCACRRCGCDAATFLRWSRPWAKTWPLRNGTAPPELAPDALALLASQPWRGNIRELRNVLEQAVMRSDASPSTPNSWSASCAKREWSPAPAPGAGSPAPDADVEAATCARLAEQVAELERKAIAAALKAHGGNKLATARQLGISRHLGNERLENPE